MTITIEYCRRLFYEPRAAGLVAVFRRHLPNAAVELIPSRGGRFEVTADGEPIFEKSKLGRHAAPGEIIALLDARFGRDGAH